MTDNGRASSPLRAAVAVGMLMIALGWVVVRASGCTSKRDESAEAKASATCVDMPEVCGHGSLSTIIEPGSANALDPNAGLLITNMGSERCPAGYLVAWILHQHSDGPRHSDGPLPFTCVPPPYAFDANGTRIDSDAKPSLVPNVADPVPGFASSPHVRPFTDDERTIEVDVNGALEISESWRKLYQEEVAWYKAATRAGMLVASHPHDFYQGSAYTLDGELAWAGGSAINFDGPELGDGSARSAIGFMVIDCDFHSHMIDGDHSVTLAWNPTLHCLIVK